jgi:hypothetical protein
MSACGPSRRAVSRRLLVAFGAKRTRLDLLLNPVANDPKADMSSSGLLPRKMTPDPCFAGHGEAVRRPSGMPCNARPVHTNCLSNAWIGHKIQMKIMGGKKIHAYFRLVHREWPGCNGRGR